MTKPWAKEIGREKLGKNGIPVSSGDELLWLGINSLDAPFSAGPEGEGILLNHRTVWVGKDHGQGHFPLAQVTPSPAQLGLSMPIPSLSPPTQGLDVSGSRTQLVVSGKSPGNTILRMASPRGPCPSQPAQDLQPARNFTSQFPRGSH